MAFSWTSIYVAGLLTFGCLNTLTTKIQFTMTSVGLDGQEKLFRKPWFGNFAMFLGMALVLLPHVYRTRRDRLKNKLKNGDLTKPLREDASPRNMPSPSRKRPMPTEESNANAVVAAAATVRPSNEDQVVQVGPVMTFLLVGIPALLDLVASGLCFIGLLYIAASIWQMFRGSMIIFSAIESVVFLGRKMRGFNWLGVFVCILGVGVVGLANTLSTSSSSGGASPAGVDHTQVLYGMGMVLVGQLFQATQVIAEEKLLKGVSVPAMQLVGYEGIWGVSVMLLLVFPLMHYLPGEDCGSQENLIDTFVMLQNSAELRSMVVLYVFSCATFNVSGMCVTGALSAVHRTMIEASRTLVIWIVDLSVHYFLNPDSAFGEAWDSYSYLQLVGFFLLLTGQAIYGGLMQVPGLDYAGSPALCPANSPESPKQFDLWSPASIRHMSPGLPPSAEAFAEAKEAGLFLAVEGDTI